VVMALTLGREWTPDKVQSTRWIGVHFG
jgi:hypothetical protein